MLMHFLDDGKVSMRTCTIKESIILMLSNMPMKVKINLWTFDWLLVVWKFRGVPGRV